MMVDTAWSAHAGKRLDEASAAAAGLRIAVEDMSAALSCRYRDQLKRAIADLKAVDAIVEKRITDEPIIIPRAA